MQRSNERARWNRTNFLGSHALLVESIQKPFHFVLLPSYERLCGRRCSASPGRHRRELDPAKTQLSRSPRRRSSTPAYDEIMQGVAPTIPIITVSSPSQVASREGLVAFRAAYGGDAFTFWVGGVLFAVVNSHLLTVDGAAAFPKEAEAQLEWLMRTMDASRCTAKQLIILCHHAFFRKLLRTTIPSYPLRFLAF